MPEHDPQDSTETTHRFRHRSLTFLNRLDPWGWKHWNQEMSDVAWAVGAGALVIAGMLIADDELDPTPRTDNVIEWIDTTHQQTELAEYASSVVASSVTSDA